MKTALKIFLGILVVCVVGIAAFLYLTLFSSSKENEAAILKAHEAFMSEATLGIAKLDVHKLVALEKLYLYWPSEDLQKSHDWSSESPYGLWQDFGINPRSDIDHLVASMILSDQGMGWGAILVGRFDPKIINKKIIKNLNPSTENWGSYALHTVEKIDLDSCRTKSKKTIYADETYVVVAPPKHIKPIIARIYGQGQISPKFSKWIKYQKSKVASAVFALPTEEEIKKSKDMFLRMGQKAAKGKEAAFSHAYLGAGMSIDRMGGFAELRVDYKDPAAAKIIVNEMQTKLTESKENWSKSLPHLGALHESLSFNDKNKSLIAAVQVTPSTLEHLKELPQELLAAMFSGFGVSTSQSGQKQGDIIDEKPIVYKTLSKVSLAPYNKDAMFAEKNVNASSGPFAMTIKKIEKKPEPNQLIEVTFEAIGTNLPNFPVNSKNLKFIVTDVLNKKGESILKLEKCGQDRNDKPAEFNSIGDKGLYKATKKVRLKPSARFTEVNQIKAKVELVLPKKVEMVPVIRAGQTIKRANLAVDIKKTAPTSLQYHVHGNEAYFLEARALNSNNQVLKKSWSSRSGFLFGPGQSKTQSFSGQAEKFEIYLATDVFENQYSLTANSTLPAPFWTSEPRASSLINEVKPYSLSRFLKKFQINRRRWKPHPKPKDAWTKSVQPQTKGPLAIYQKKATNYSVDLLIASYPAEELSGYPQALELKITKVITKDGRVLKPGQVVEKKPMFALEPKWIYLSDFFKKDWRARLNRQTKKWEVTSPDWYTEASFQISRVGTVQFNEVKEFEGQLVLRFPKSLRTLEVNPLQAMHDPIISEKIKGEVTSISSTEFELFFFEGGENLVSITEYTKDGTPFGERSISLTPKPSGYKSAIWNRQGLHHAKLTFAVQWDEKAWPIKFRF